MSDQLVSKGGGGDSDGGMSGGGGTAPGWLNDALDDVGQEFATLEEDFGEMGFGAAGDGSPEMDELNQESEGTPFEVSGQGETAMGMSILDIADGEGGGEEFLGGIVDKVKNAIKKRAQKIIKKITDLVRRLGAKAKKCLKKVTAAIKAFKAKKWGTAIKRAWEAYRCLRKLA